MANYTKLKDFLSQLIGPSYAQDATGALVQESLEKVLDSIIDGGRLFKGIATPATNPRTPDADVFYIAYQDGTYTNFGGLTIKDHVAVIYNLPSGEWTYQNLTLNESGIKKYAPGGSAPEKPSLTPITHPELVRMMYGAELIPGQKYLIGDYEYGAYLKSYPLEDNFAEDFTCEVIQQPLSETPSILVVEAVSSIAIAEEATIFYNGSSGDIITVSVRYCPMQPSTQIPPWLTLSPSRLDFPLLERRDYNGRPIYIYRAPERQIYTYGNLSGVESFGFLDEEGNPLPQMYPVRVFAESVWNGFTGAVTWMRDEFGNEAPFDFKLYQFTNFSRPFVAMLGLRSPTEVMPLIQNGYNIVYRDICPMFVASANNTEISRSVGVLDRTAYSSLDNCFFVGRLTQASVRNVIMPQSALVANYSTVMGNGKVSYATFTGSLDYGAYVGEPDVFVRVGGGGSRRSVTMENIGNVKGLTINEKMATLIKIRAIGVNSSSSGNFYVMARDIRANVLVSEYMFPKKTTSDSQSITLEWIAEAGVEYSVAVQSADGTLQNTIVIRDVLE